MNDSIGGRIGELSHCQRAVLILRACNLGSRTIVVAVVHIWCMLGEALNNTERILPKQVSPPFTTAKQHAQAISTYIIKLNVGNMTIEGVCDQSPHASSKQHTAQLSGRAHLESMLPHCRMKA